MWLEDLYCTSSCLNSFRLMLAESVLACVGEEGSDSLYDTGLTKGHIRIMFISFRVFQHTRIYID